MKTPLTLYRRHRAECEAGHAEDSRSGEFEEGRRIWKRCACLIHASGTLGGKFRRRQTGKSKWEEAKAIAAEWEKADSWDRAVQVEDPPPPATESGSKRTPVAEAMAAYLAGREGARIAPSTMRKYRTFCKQLQTYAESKGYVMLDQFTSSDIDVFYANWKLGARAKGKRLGTLRSFFRFAMAREWLAKNPVTPDLKPPLGANKSQNKYPFTDEELERVYAACDRIKDVRWTTGDKEGVWTGADVKVFIWFIVHTGLRISDAALFSIDRLKGNEVFLRAKKNGGDVFMWLPDWLRDRLIARSRTHGLRPFATGRSEKVETITDLWRRRINKVFELAGKFAQTPTPHRFRHTFARTLLQRGVPVADVADLLGDDEDTVREHYARWVPERQARLTNILRDAFQEKPRSKLVAVK